MADEPQVQPQPQAQPAETKQPRRAARAGEPQRAEDKEKAERLGPIHEDVTNARLLTEGGGYTHPTRQVSPVTGFPEGEDPEEELRRTGVLPQDDNREEGR